MSHLHHKTYKSHETVRERNKREQRRFDLTTDGRYNEFKFKLNGINKEQRLVEKDLERIRAGVHRPPNSAIATSQKSFNPASVRSLAEQKLRKKQEKHSPKRSPRPRRKSDEVDIDTDMLVEYIQKLKDANVIDMDNVMNDPADNDTLTVNHRLTSDTKMSQSSVHQAERSVSLNNKQSSLPIIDDKDIQSKGSSDSKGDLIQKNKALSADQRHLKRYSPGAAAMSTPESGVILSQKVNPDSVDAKIHENAKTTDVLSRRKSSPENDYNSMKQVYNYDSFGNYGQSKKNISSDKQWEEARNARYVRTREKLERDRELSVKEIFDQSKP